MGNLFQDLRCALRPLRKSPGFAMTAVVTLALGIGATTAIFTLVHAVLLKSLPVTKPQELYRLGDKVHCCNWGGMILRTAFFQVGIGLAIGIPAAVGAGRLITNHLYAVKPYDPAILALAAFALGGAALVATVIPAQRAASVNPTNALRSE